jgi:hypothetical protein
MLPNVVQLHHLLEDHKDIHICHAKSTKHIHQKSVNDCSFFHQPVHFVFTLSNKILIKAVTNNTCYSPLFLASKYTQNTYIFSPLRAPPFSFIS